MLEGLFCFCFFFVFSLGGVQCCKTVVRRRPEAVVPEGLGSSLGFRVLKMGSRVRFDVENGCSH